MTIKEEVLKNTKTLSEMTGYNTSNTPSKDVDSKFKYDKIPPVSMAAKAYEKGSNNITENSYLSELDKLIEKARKAGSGDITGLIEARSLYEKYHK